jgi:hypothetical protein
MRTLLLVLFCTLSGCYHANGQPFTGPEVYKLGRDMAVAACDVIDSPLGDAATVLVQGAAMPVMVARGACHIVRAFPAAVGVVVDSHGQGHPVVTE